MSEAVVEVVDSTLSWMSNFAHVVNDELDMAHCEHRLTGSSLCGISRGRRADVGLRGVSVGGLPAGRSGTSDDLGVRIVRVCEFSDNHCVCVMCG
jgi:hypothetical protein